MTQPGFALPVLVIHATSESHHINSESHRQYWRFALTVLVSHTTLIVSHTDAIGDLH